MRSLASLALTLCLFPAPSLTAATANAADDPEEQRFYQVVFVTVKDAAKYGEYVQRLGPVVARYGARADRVLIPDTVFPEELGRPNFVNVVSYDSREAFEEFEQDPEFHALAALRAEAIEFRGVNATLLENNTTEGDSKARTYMVEMVEYRNDDPQLFRRYRRFATPVMRAHGFRTELSLRPVGAFGGLEAPDEVALHYFESSEGRSAAEQDPRHQEMEALYAEAIEGLIWVEGRVFVP